MLTLTITGRRGALTTFSITGTTAGELSVLRDHTAWFARGLSGLAIDDSGACYVTGAGSRNDVDRMQGIVRQLNVVAARAADSTLRAPFRDLPTRTVVEVGSVKPGDSISGQIVTGLGKCWTLREACQYGARPELEGQLVQYAYFS